MRIWNLLKQTIIRFDTKRSFSRKYTIIKLKVYDQGYSFTSYHKAKTIRSSTMNEKPKSLKIVNIQKSSYYFSDSKTFRKWSLMSTNDRIISIKIVYFHSGSFTIGHNRIPYMISYFPTQSRTGQNQSSLTCLKWVTLTQCHQCLFESNGLSP